MIKSLNEKVSYLAVIDIGLIIVKLWPSLLTIDFTILIALVILCAAKPCYDF
jgi:hypothetical protein